MLSQYSMHTHVWQGWIEVLMASIEYCLLAATQTTTFKDSSHILKAPGSMFCLDLVRYLSIKKSIEVNPPRSETAKRITFTNYSKCQTHFENPKFCLSAKENLCDDKWLRKESSSAPLKLPRVICSQLYRISVWRALPSWSSSEQKAPGSPIRFCEKLLKMSFTCFLHLVI